MRSYTPWLIVGFIFLTPAFSLRAQESVTSSVPAAPASAESPVNSLFQDQFYLATSKRQHYKTTQTEGLLVLEQAAPSWNSKVAVVSDFAPNAIRTQVLRDIQSVDQAREWIRAQKKTIPYQGVTITQLTISTPHGVSQERFWVGNKSFPTLEKAQAEITQVQSLIEMQGGDFQKAVALADQMKEKEPVPEQKEVKTQAQFEQEEEIALKWADQLNIGEALFGPIQGISSGEPILYQSFGEGTWRNTNLAERKWNSWVGYWTNRLVFKGIRFPYNTLDPYVEMVIAPEATGNDGGNQLDLNAGLEWRPLARSGFLENFKPWGSIPLLKFAKNYRFYIQYMERRNLKDEIANIRDFDTRIGVDIFYEWGIELPSPDQKVQETGLEGFLVKYVWGEYYGNYNWRDTNFTTHKVFEAAILDSTVSLGLKIKLMDLPPNRFNDELMLMPYLRWAMTSNSEFSNPADNRYYLAVGLRWMPFRSYQFVNNEWLLKTKVFGEYLAIGKVRNWKQGDGTPWPDEDWRVGVAFSLRRY